MTFNQSELDAKAVTTGNLLIVAIFESKLIEGICETYEQVCRETLARFEVVPKELGDDDYKRLLFEVICFATFIIMGQEVPKHIVRTRALLTTEPDAEGIRHFNDKLLDRLSHHLEGQGFAWLREVVVTAISPNIQFGLGEPLNAAKRIADYLEGGSSLQAAKLFSQYVAYAIDPDQYVALTIIGMGWVESIIDLTRIVLKAVFKAEEST